VIAALEDVWLEQEHGAVLRGVSLTLRRGERLALTGDNGAGKSSLVRLLLGLTPPSRGRVEPVPRGCGYAPQAAREHTFPWFSPLRNVAMGQLLFGEPDALERGRAALQRFAPALEGRRTCWGLSGGEAQALSLARALAAPGPAVLMDEPFSALASGARASLRFAVADALGGRALLLVTHQRDDAAALDARVLRLEDGRLVAESAS
jgi:ABC-type nitrate/sulfonate/bicarbonate transport system ATPase subunit